MMHTRRNDRGDGMVGTMASVLLLSMMTLFLVQQQLRIVESEIDRDVRKRLGEVVVQVLEPATYQDCSSVSCGPDTWTGFLETSPGVWENGHRAILDSQVTTSTGKEWSLRLDARRYTLLIEDPPTNKPDCMPSCLGWLPNQTPPEAFVFPMRAVTITEVNSGIVVAGQQVRSIPTP